MTRLLVSGVCGLLCSVSLTFADEVATDPLTPPTAPSAHLPQSPGVAAENCQADDNQTLAVQSTVACQPNPPDGSVTENGWARQWTIQGDTSLKQVRYGVETCRDLSGQGRSCSIEVRAYSAPGFPSFGGAQVLSTANVDIPDGTQLELSTADFPAVPLPDGTRLVIEIYVPATFRTQFGFFAGSNANGQSAPSYLRSPACALTNWTDGADIGFPDMHLIHCWSDEGGIEGGCQYALRKNSKAKKGCGVCPRRGELVPSGDPCDDVKDCPRKFSLSRLDCPDGGPGFCKKIKGKRDSCL